MVHRIKIAVATLFWICKNPSVLKLRYRLRLSRKINDICILKDTAIDQTMFGCGTGLSVAKINSLKQKTSRIKIIAVSTSPLHLLRLYDIRADYWFIHAPDILKDVVDFLEENTTIAKNLEGISIIIPKPFTDSKKINFFNPYFLKLCSFLNYNVKIYEFSEALRENIQDGWPSLCPVYFYPSQSTVVESVFIPIGLHLGVKKLLFAGVDHIDHGHFWDRKKKYTNIKGESLSFLPYETIFSAFLSAKKVYKNNIIVNRLTHHTQLLHYPIEDWTS